MKKIINGIAVFLTGSNNSKPIIFIHGFPYDHSMWQKQIEEFGNDYFCVSYDVRGLGESPTDDGQFTMEAFVDDLEMILDGLKLEKSILCGLSMGGYISLRAVERFQNKFSALILCDTKSEADNNEGKLKRAAAIRQINSGGFAEFVESFIRNCFSEKFINEQKEEYKKIVDRSKKNSPLGVKGCLLAMAGRTDTTGSLNKINLPTLLICGREDKLTPPDIMKSMSDKISRAKFSIVENAGHMSPVEQPAVVNKAIKDFLTEVKY